MAVAVAVAASQSPSPGCNRNGSKRLECIRSALPKLELELELRVGLGLRLKLVSYSAAVFTGKGYQLSTIYTNNYNTWKNACRVEFTNIKCNSTDLDFSDFEYCYLKSVNRSYKYASLKVKLFQIPITKVSMRFGLYKRFSGYRPFLYNFTVDCCKFKKNKKSLPIVRFFHDIINEYSNMNHSCPYNHDIVLEKLTIAHVNDRFVNVLQFPEGDYMFEMHWLVYDINRAVVELYFTFS
ncbi:uncharacterized protein LOC111076998 [Drosophila obscura]|uniref:uncharacterized protein LOC111076998 n=1 Tax=Drosophila obscura TaxID=7282 RepID=UPI001BB14201|nr:uncharacterized protein LOC111076998 [Drosophila obscura]